MATIDMVGKWNMRVMGLTINGNSYPVIEVYFNLGYSPNVGDILNFGTLEEYAQDMQIRLNTIGTSWYFIVSCHAKKPTDLVFSSVDITDNISELHLIQTVGENNVAFNTSVRVDYQSYRIGFCYPSPGFGSEMQAFSPIVFYHDEFSDKLIYSTSIGAVTPAYISRLDPVLESDSGLAVINQFPVIQPSASTSPNFVVSGFIDNVLERTNPSDSDPYNPNGEHAGGDGENQNTDEMADETLPTISAADTGFVTLYKPSISQMNALANYMWGTLDIDSFKKVFANPMDVILGLSILPGIVPSGGSSSVKVGNIDTGISMTKVGNQYVKFNCGSVTIKRKWGAFLDYSPYTKAFIYLPFIGVQPIDVDEIMNKSVSVSYNIDVLSGGCCAFVKVDGTTLYSYIGQCACSVPVTGKDWSTMINGVLGAVSGVAGTIGSIASGNVAGAISGIASVAQNVAGAKPSYQRSGTMGGMGGMMGIKTPYIIIERPVQAVPGYQNQIIGYPSFITRMIGQFRGYTEIEQCHLENIPCTGDEMIEIENILKTGVIL